MADKKARQYSVLTIKKLYALSGNRCAFPNCDVMFLNWEDDTNFSNICHIEDANQNTHKADRYNPNMTSKERADYNNLLLLCPNHHIETNNPEKYTVNVLREMKRNHEEDVLQKLSGQNLITKNPSALNIVIGSLGSSIFNGANVNDPLSAPDPEEKILYNNVIRYKAIIEEYRVYQGRLNKVYEEIEKQGSTRKEFVLHNIKSAYLLEKGKYNNIDQIRANADNIIENVQAKLWEIIESSSNKNTDLPIEAIQISLYVILVDAFMRCSILEEPPKQ
ncbi:ABC-three component system protein [Bergeyella sp. RCAD1439]|uniref:ABC-three component system protein n=1 Tax=Bergeyella anatis TaxID=3113737 RepID=UPI002E192A6B|nr:ABC-three component system protein [Bergeyella sp. RCAD1439]